MGKGYLVDAGNKLICKSSRAASRFKLKYSATGIPTSALLPSFASKNFLIFVHYLPIYV